MAVSTYDLHYPLVEMEPANPVMQTTKDSLDPPFPDEEEIPLTPPTPEIDTAAFTNMQLAKAVIQNTTRKMNEK